MLAKYSVRKPYTVIVGIILVIVLGVISFQNMTTDLLPSMNLPYVVVYTTYIGATPEQVESEVTRPLESSFATLTDIKNIQSSSQDNVSMVILEFNDGANMDTALIEISSKVDQLAGEWDDSIGAPVTMKINPDMLPVAILSVSRDDMDIVELSNYIEEELVPEFESLNGVASATASGIIEQKIDITIEQSRIDTLNSAILREVDEELADVEQQLNDAQAQLSDGKSKLARAKRSAFGQIDSALEAIDQGAEQLTPAIEQLTQQRADLDAQRTALQASIAQMDALINMTDEEKAQLKLLEQQLAGLRQQKAELEKQLANAESADHSALIQQRDEAQAQRDELNAERTALQKYIDDLTLMDSDALKAAIATLEKDIAAAETALNTAQSDLATLQTERAATQKLIDDLTAQIESMGGQASPKPTEPSDTAAPSSSASAAPTQSASPSATVDPVQSASPSDTVAPVQSASPSDMVDPAQSASPSDTADPIQSASPSDTNNPAASESIEPVQTDGVNLTAEPSQTDVSATGETATETTDNGKTQTNTPIVEENKQDEAAAESSPELNIPAASSKAVIQLPGFAALADEPSLDALKAQLNEAKAKLSDQDTQINAKNEEISGLNRQLEDQNSDLSAKKKALEVLENDIENVEVRIQAAQKEIASLTTRIATLDEEIESLNAQIDASGSEVVEDLRKRIAALEQQIQTIENSDAYKALIMISDPDSLNAQYVAAQEGLAKLDAGIAQVDSTLDKLNQGIIPGGFIEGIDQDTKLSDAREQLESARKQAADGFAEAEAQLAEADSELASARSEFNEKRDEALENAGLDGVITVEMVSGIIGAQNFAMPAGYVYDLENEQVLVRVGDEFASLDELKQMKLFNLGLDSVDEVRLLDVASVEITDNRDDVFTKLDGADGILLSFDKQSTYSTADVAESILDHAEALMAEDSRLHIVDLMNQGEYITIIVDSVLNNLISGGLLAILILLLFLMDFRPTLIVAFSIPVSVVVAFVCMYFTGITLNVLSLSGLGLGIGMLVDNSIVAIENIYRLHDEEGLPLLKSCVVGVQKVAGALVASTLTTICVFLPVVFVEGMARDLFADMGLTIAYSLLASLVVAMTVVPSMSAGLLRRSKPKKHRIFSKIQSGYIWLLRGALRFKPIVLLVVVALLAFSVMQISSMGISFMPEVNSRQMSASLTVDSEMTTERQRDQALSIMEDMMEVDGIETIGLMSGSGSMVLSSGGGMSYYIIVDEEAGRENAEIASDLYEIAAEHQADLSVQTSTMDISMMTGSGISVEIMGDDIETLQSIARDVAGIAASVEGTKDVNDGAEESVPEMRIVVDKEKAIDEGLTTAQVYQFIAGKLYGSVEITSVTLDGKTLSVNLIDGKNAELKPEDLEDLEIEVAGEDEDKMVRIGDIAEISESTSMNTINRSSQQRTATVSFAIEDGYSANLVSRDFEAKLADYQVPEGYSIELAGENESVMAIMEDLIWMILVAIVLIFLIMVAQFQSFKSPIIVMFTIPLAFTGGMLALLITKLDLSIVSMLGFLVLAGVVVNNGIVFIDCVNQLRIEGMNKRDALLEAGRQRLRPILMTALTTILGMSTMALGHGTGAEMMQPMAVVSIGGLTYSTLMTLFVVPVLYDMVNGKKMKAREIQMIREVAGLNGDEVLEGNSRVEVSADTKSAPAAAPVERTATDAPAPAVTSMQASVGEASSFNAKAPANHAGKRVRIQVNPRKKPTR